MQKNSVQIKSALRKYLCDWKCGEKEEFWKVHWFAADWAVQEVNFNSKKSSLFNLD